MNLSSLGNREITFTQLPIYDSPANAGRTAPAIQHTKICHRSSVCLQDVLLIKKQESKTYGSASSAGNAVS